ncbi:MAG: hypothetical protein ACI8Z0_000717, partial [Lentimonas sp.]
RCGNLNRVHVQRFGRGNHGKHLARPLGNFTTTDVSRRDALTSVCGKAKQCHGHKMARAPTNGAASDATSSTTRLIFRERRIDSGGFTEKS